MSGRKRPGSLVLAYVGGIACLVWFCVCAFQAAMGPTWDGTWSRVPAVIGLLVVVVCAYRADDSLLAGVGGGIFFLLWCLGLQAALPLSLSRVRRRSLAARAPIGAGNAGSPRSTPSSGHEPPR
ncbi:MAG TPA: hypothetical protein VN915_04190 [Elusimicrobiota bacterium]|nr:hypothetical protein [Elusimicrobiota bacterium]